MKDKPKTDPAIPADPAFDPDTKPEDAGNASSLSSEYSVAHDIPIADNGELQTDGKTKDLRKLDRGEQFEHQGAILLFGTYDEGRDIVYATRVDGTPVSVYHDKGAKAERDGNGVYRAV